MLTIRIDMAAAEWTEIATQSYLSLLRVKNGQNRYSIFQRRPFSKITIIIVDEWQEPAHTCCRYHCRHHQCTPNTETTNTNDCRNTHTTTPHTWKAHRTGPQQRRAHAHTKNGLLFALVKKFMTPKRHFSSPIRAAYPRIICVESYNNTVVSRNLFRLLPSRAAHTHSIVRSSGWLFAFDINISFRCFTCCRCLK